MKAYAIHVQCMPASILDNFGMPMQSKASSLAVSRILAARASCFMFTCRRAQWTRQTSKHSELASEKYFLRFQKYFSSCNACTFAICVFVSWPWYFLNKQQRKRKHKY